MMNGRNLRYRKHNIKTREKKPFKFGGRVVRQIVVCSAAFLICLPISKTDTAMKAYISKMLVSTSDIEAAKTHFIGMCISIAEKYPIIAENGMWQGFVQFLNETEQVDPKQKAEETPPSADGGLDLVAKASPEEFVYPENVNMIMPINGEVTSAFGEREHPVSGGESSHYGVDIAGNSGDIVISTAPGKVVEVKEHEIYGNCVLVQHTNRIKSFYAHLDTVAVKEGDIAGDNTVIGTVGSTGVATGPHLHFGVKVDDEPVDPEIYIKMKHR